MGVFELGSCVRSVALYFLFPCLITRQAFDGSARAQKTTKALRGSESRRASFGPLGASGSQSRTATGTVVFRVTGFHTHDNKTNVSFKIFRTIK